MQSSNNLTNGAVRVDTEAIFQLTEAIQNLTNEPGHPSGYLCSSKSFTSSFSLQFGLSEWDPSCATQVSHHR